MRIVPLRRENCNKVNLRRMNSEEILKNNILDIVKRCFNVVKEKHHSKVNNSQ